MSKTTQRDFADEKYVEPKLFKNNTKITPYKISIYKGFSNFK